MTNQPRSCEPYRENLDAFALGALEAEDTAALAGHLQACARCRDELTEIEQAVALVPHALQAARPVQPPPRLRSAILSQPSRQSARFPGRWVLRPWVWGAAAAIIFVAVASTTYLGVALATERAAKHTLAAQVSQDEIVMEVVDSVVTDRRVLRAVSPNAGRGYGKLFTRPDVDFAVLTVSRMPPTEPGRIYRVWVQRDGTMTSPGVVSTNESGFGRLVFPLDAATARGIDRVVVSYEPADVRLIASSDTLLAWQR